MKHIKKLITILLIFAMLFTMVACNDEKPEEPSVDSSSDEVEEQETVFDFGDYVVEWKDTELLESDYEFDCIMLTLAYANIDPEESGNLGANIKYTATQNGVELSLASLSEYWDNEPAYVYEGEVVDFHIGFTLQREYNQVYYDMSEIEVVLQDKNSDLFYTFIVDPSVLDDSGLRTGGGKGTGETDGYGDFESIFIPANFELRLDSWKENNPHFVSVASTDWIYFNFRNYTYEEDLKYEYEYLKENYTNEQIDVSANYGGIDWIGFQYDDGYGGYNFYGYTIIGNNYLLVSSAGFMFDDEVTQLVLGSVVMAQ